MTVINTNISALIAHQTLARNDRDMSQAMTRLSTGMRINSAGDDAAGLAIATRMTAQMQGLDQAVRNANDAVSMIQTADGASIELGNIIQRMRVLAVQAISDTYTATDRQALNAEFSGLQEQLEIIATQTQWNGAPLMTGEIGNKGTSTFHIGANAEQSMEITFGDWTAAGHGVYRNGGSTPNNIGPSDLLESATSPAVQKVAAIYTSPISNDNAIGSTGLMRISDGTNTLTVDASNVNDRAALVSKIQATPGYENLLFTVNDNGGQGVNGTPAVYQTAMSATEVAAMNTDLVLRDSAGTEVTVTGSELTSLSTTEAVIAKIQAHANYQSLNFSIAGYDTADAGNAIDGFIIRMEAVKADTTAPSLTLDKVAQNITLTSAFQAPSDAGLSLIYKEAGAVAVAPTVTLDGMSRDKSKHAEFDMKLLQMDLEETANPSGAYSQAASDVVPFTISDGTTTLKLDDVRNLIRPTYDGNANGNNQLLVDAVRAMPSYDSLLFTVEVSNTDVNTLKFNYKTPGAVDFTPTVNFGKVAAAAAQYESPIDASQVINLTSITVDGTAIAVSPAAATITALAEKIETALSGLTPAPAFTVKANDANDALLFEYDNVGAVTTPVAVTGLVFAVSSQVRTLTDEVTYIASGAGANSDVNEKKSLDMNAASLATAGKIVLTDGTTTITVPAPAVPYASVNEMVTAIQTVADPNALAANDTYGELLFTVSHAGGKLVLEHKTKDTNFAAGAYLAIDHANAAEVEIIPGVNAVDGNAPRTVTQTALQKGADDDPTPEVTRHGVTGVAAKEAVPFTPSIDVLTSDNAKAALDNLLTALDGINMQRASYGAAINRLEHTMDNLMQMSSNAAATRGRIQDADYAKESTELARTQIVQQASTAMLTQANQSAQSVLALLKG